MDHRPRIRTSTASPGILAIAGELLECLNIIFIQTLVLTGLEYARPLLRAEFSKFPMNFWSV